MFHHKLIQGEILGMLPKSKPDGWMDLKTWSNNVNLDVIEPLKKRQTVQLAGVFSHGEYNLLAAPHPAPHESNPPLVARGHSQHHIALQREQGSARHAWKGWSQ